MTATARLRRRLALLLRSEHGMALPTALFATVASLGLGGAAIMASVDVQHGAKRDNDSKSAIAAADAGARVAMMRLNRYQTSLTEGTVCVGPKGEAQVATNGWCPATTPETVGASTFSYRFAAVGSGNCSGYALCAVSTGTADGVTRRVLVSFDDDGVVEGGGENDPGGGEPGGESEPEGEEILDESDGVVTEGLIGQDSITTSGNADIQVGVGTNGNLTTSGNASICGDIRVGVGKKWSKSGNAKQCSGYDFAEGNRTLPPVSSFMPADIATNNSNWRLAYCTQTKPTKVPTGCQSDGYTGGNWSPTSPWNPTTRAIQASGNTTLTLSGGDYWICSISLSGNSQLIMGDGFHVRFFFDTPEHCGTTTQINMSGNNRIAATGYQPDEDQFEMPGFFLLGSTTTASSINLSGNHSTTNEFVIYAPNTNINISGNATHKGLIAGRTINISGNGEIMNDSGFMLPPELNPWYEEDDPGDGGDEGGEDDPSGDGSDGGAKYYTAQHYVECTGIPSAAEAPSAGC